MEWLGILFIVIAGVLNAIQTAIIAALSKGLGQVALASPVVFAVGLVFTLLLMPLMGVRLSDFRKLAEPAWWSYLGGLCGAVFILAMLSQTQKFGSGVFVAATGASPSLVSRTTRLRSLATVRGPNQALPSPNETLG